MLYANQKGKITSRKPARVNKIMKVVLAINLVSSFMFMHLQSGYLSIGLKDSKQIISNPRRIGNFQDILIHALSCKNNLC